MMKKIISMFLICILILSSVSVFAEESNTLIEELKALHILPATYGNADTDALTREELAYIAAHLLFYKDCEPTETGFNDVKASNEYSGYIALMDSMDIMNGTDEDNFNPSDKVTTGMFFKVLFELIGYGDFARIGGGYPDGYLSLARSIDSLRKYAVNNAYITRDIVPDLLYDVINTRFGGISYYYDNGALTTKTDSTDRFSILGHHLGISVYSGNVDNIDEEKGIVTVSSVCNEYDTNYTLLPTGSTVNFKSKNIKTYDFKNAPVLVYADSEKNIVHMSLRSNTEIKYGYIASVNNNTKENALYNINYVNKLTLLDDKHEYKLAQGAVMYYNGRATTAAVRMTGNFARLVITDGKISSIDSWDLSDGGLVKDITAAEIKYLGGIAVRKIDKLDSYNKKVVFLDGEPSTISSLSAGVVFDYYKEDDFIVFVASSKKITDVFSAVGTDSLDIGNSSYIANTVYFSKDGTNYKANDYDIAMGCEITAYFAPSGHVRYVEVKNSENATKDIFVAVYGGTNETFTTKGELKVLCLDSQREKKVFSYNNKTRFEDGITIDLINQNASDNTYSNDVYVFTVTDAGYIRKVSKPLPFRGYVEGGKTSATVTSSATNAAPEVTNPPYVTVAGKQLHFSESCLMLALYEIDGEMEAAPITYLKNIAGRYLVDVTLDFYGSEDLIDEPLLIVATGAMDRLGSKPSYGFVTGERSTTLDERGNVGTKLSILTRSGISEYFVTPEYARTINDYSIIRYASNCNFSENEIYVYEELVNLSEPHTNWDINEYDQNSKNGLFRGVVEKVGLYTLWLDDGTAFTISNSGSVFTISLDESDDKERFSMISKEDIYSGDDIVFLLGSSGMVNAIINIE